MRTYDITLRALQICYFSLLYLPKNPWVELVYENSCCNIYNYIWTGFLKTSMSTRNLLSVIMPKVIKMAISTFLAYTWPGLGVGHTETSWWLFFASFRVSDEWIFFVHGNSSCRSSFITSFRYLTDNWDRLRRYCCTCTIGHYKFENCTLWC